MNKQTFYELKNLLNKQDGEKDITRIIQQDLALAKLVEKYKQSHPNTLDKKDNATIIKYLYLTNKITIDDDTYYKFYIEIVDEKTKEYILQSNYFDNMEIAINWSKSITFLKEDYKIYIMKQIYNTETEEMSDIFKVKEITSSNNN